MPMERVSSGIEGLDPLIGGGFIKGRSYLISGEPGTGKTLFSLQYILNGIKKGEKRCRIHITGNACTRPARKSGRIVLFHLRSAPDDRSDGSTPKGAWHSTQAGNIRKV